MIGLELDRVESGASASLESSIRCGEREVARALGTYSIASPRG